MKEILPGVFHWKTFHEGIQAYVHSYYTNATDPPVLIDPRVPAQGIEWFAAHGAPQHVYLTNRHHYRHSETQPDNEHTHKDTTQKPEETAHHLPLHGGILSLGDAIVRERGRLGFVPDAYMGDDPEGVKRGLRKAFLKHLREHEFDLLLFAHGTPKNDDARAGLHAFLDRLER